MTSVSNMTVVIKKEFRDKDDFSKVYLVGSVHEFDGIRAKELISRGLVEMISEEIIELDYKPRRGRKKIDE